MNINDIIAEEKVRLDPKCWTGKKIGNPKTKMKGGVRVNNCVPAESVMEFAQTGGGDAGDYLRTLASAWYNDVYNTGNLQKGIKSQQDVEKIFPEAVESKDKKTLNPYYLTLLHGETIKEIDKICTDLENNKHNDKYSDKEDLSCLQYSHFFNFS